MDKTLAHITQADGKIILEIGQNGLGACGQAEAQVGEDTAQWAGPCSAGHGQGQGQLTVRSL